MRLIKGLIIAFSIYSRIPMPRFEWKEEDMKYNLCFLPFIGMLIGALVRAGEMIGDMLCIPLLCKVCVVSSMPLLITGGFHADGYMDVHDAFGSYKPKEEKLKILKDPHIGAFAVIAVIKYMAVWVGALAAVYDRSVASVCAVLPYVYVISRIGTAMASVSLKKAKNEGMLKEETAQSGKFQLIVMIAEFIMCMIMIGMTDIYAAVLLAAVLIVFYIYYRYRMYREFGGVTGDTAGYFVCESELYMLVALAVYSIVVSM